MLCFHNLNATLSGLGHYIILPTVQLGILEEITIYSHTQIQNTLVQVSTHSNMNDKEGGYFCQGFLEEGSSA